MRIQIILAAAVALAISASAMAAPLSAYGRLPAIEQVEISPDGKRLAMISTTAEQRRIVIRSADDLKTIAVLNAGDQKLRDLRWAGSNYLLITTSSTAQTFGVRTGARAEQSTTLYYDIARSRQEPLLKAVPEMAMNVTIGEPQVRTVGGKPVVLVGGVQFVNSQGRMSLFSINLDTGKGMIAVQGEPGTQRFVVDERGNAAAQTTYDRATGQWDVLVRDGRGWKSATAGQTIGQPQLLGLGRDGRSLLVGVGDGSRRELRELNPNGVWGETLNYPNVSGYVHDPETDRLIGTFSDYGDLAKYTFLNPADQAAWTAIQATYPGEKVELASWSTDRKRAVVRVESPTEGAAYAFVDLTTRKATWLGALYPEVEAKDISPVRQVSYKAADGLTITGYLTLPRDKTVKALPLVVLVHGGPASRDEPGFDWWSQALASRGYAVLQANFRGSAGVNPQLLAAGIGEWGRKMQTDLSDGVRYLAAEGIVDPGRVCIAGASYGGYASLAGATLDKGVYRCAASVSGPTDMSRMLGFAQRNTGGDASVREWARQIGAQGPQDPKLNDISPAFKADAVDIPILLIHGRDDSVVPFEQSQVMADALRRAGKPFELVTLTGEDHWLSRGDTRLKMLESLATFLERNNPPT